MPALEDFVYDRISSVQTSSRAMFAKLTLYASGNKAEIDQIAPKQMGTALGDLVRTKHKGGDAGSVVPSAESALDKLRKTRQRQVECVRQPVRIPGQRPFSW